MSSVIYKIVKHDGGWAYEVNGTFSEPFHTHDAARRAARLAAEEQAEPGDSAQILYEDEQGQWHRERSDGNDRPKPVVKG